MSRSVLGFKSLAFSKYLYNDPKGNLDKLKADFQRYNQRSNSLQYDKDDQGNTVIKFRPSSHGIEGIEWLIRADIWKDRRLAPVEVQVYPKLLIGSRDDITTATYEDMSAIMAKFDSIAHSISPLLGTFENYRLDEINYCAYFDVNELLPGCTLEQLTYLIERARTLPIYDPDPTGNEKLGWTGFDPNQYLVWDGALNIICYRKNIGLLKRERDTICFEFQCKCRSALDNNLRAERHLSSKFNLYEDVLVQKVCNEIIDHYLTVIIGKGSWYTLQEAIAKIKQSSDDKATKIELIEDLKFVSECPNAAMAAERCQNDERFLLILGDLDKMGISPVTIPEDWGIDYIPNLLRAYHNEEMNGFEDRYAKWQMEQDLEYMAEMAKAAKEHKGKIPSKPHFILFPIQ